MKKSRGSKGISLIECINPRLTKYRVRFALAEYEDKQIIFTPNALTALIQAAETARELGSTAVKPEHVVLGILKSKKGSTKRSEIISVTILPLSMSLLHLSFQISAAPQ